MGAGDDYDNACEQDCQFQDAETQSVIMLLKLINSDMLLDNEACSVPVLRSVTAAQTAKIKIEAQAMHGPPSHALGLQIAQSRYYCSWTKSCMTHNKEYTIIPRV